MTGWAHDDALREVGNELRTGFANELRSEAEDRERSAAIAYRRGRTLRDVVAEARSRGDRVTVSVADRTWPGLLTHVGTDIASLELIDGSLDVWLGAPLAVRTIAPSAAAGHGPDPDRPATFRARLLELELAGATVEIVGPVLSGAGPTRIGSVGRDHVLLAGDGDVAVSVHAIHAVLVRSPR